MGPLASLLRRLIFVAVFVSTPSLVRASSEEPPAPEPLPETLEPGLLAVIEQVSPASRAVLLLHYQQDLSIEETAIVLDIPVGTAKSRLAYGVSVLRKRINQKGTR